MAFPVQIPPGDQPPGLEDSSRELQASLTFSFDQMAYLVRLSRWVLATSFGSPAESPGTDPGGWEPAFVNVTLRRNGQLSGSMGASKATLPEAVKAATWRAALDGRFQRTILSADVASTAIEVWIQTGSEALRGDPATISGSIRMGFDGVRIVLGENTAYYKPSVAITSSVPSPQRLLENLSQKAGLPETAWTDPQAVIERTSWVHAMESAKGRSGILMLRGLRSCEVRSSGVDELGEAARLSVARSLAIQKCDGSLAYIYNPFKDAWAPAQHRVRLAGCAYSLALAAQHAVTRGQSGVAQGAARILRFMMTHTAPGPFENGRFVTETDSGEAWGKLGATALTALAAEYEAGAPWREHARQLVNTMLGLQNADGSFTCTIGREASRENDQNFFPGECLLALAVCAHRTQDERVAHVIGRSFSYYSEHFRSRPATAFVLWQTDAWTRIARWMAAGSFPSLGPAGPQIADIVPFVFKQVDWLLRLQYTESTGCPEEDLGGFKIPQPPAISSAAYGEAVIRACGLASLVNDAERVRRYRRAALSCLKFLLRLQILPGTEAFFPRPALVTGAATASLESFEIRCDYDQHFTTACLAALDTPSLWE